MKRLSYILALVALLLPMSVQAGRITEQEALQRARQFLASKAGNAPQLRTAALTRAARRRTQGVTDDPYYIFNAPQQGFVVASAFDNAQPVLAYGIEGSLDVDNLPEHMQAWLDGYGEQLAWLDSHPEASRTRASVQGGPISPMLKSAWGQHEPYNLLCPVQPRDNQHCLTGCVATAMAEVMHYYRWPEKLAADIPEYTTSSYYLSGMSFAAGTPIDWDNMLPTYGLVSDTEVQKQAVAQLMAMCGSSLKTKYDSYSSAASLWDFVEALYTYFDYDAYTINTIDRTDFTQTEWEQIIYDELQAGRVVPYVGYTAEDYPSTHMFIIDGYDGNDYFHIDWGWNGGSSGYFLLAVMNYDSAHDVVSPAGPLGYGIGHGAVVGIQKNTGEEPLGWKFLGTTYFNMKEKEVVRSSTSDNFTFRLFGSLFKWKEPPYKNYDYAIGLFSLDGKMLAQYDEHLNVEFKEYFNEFESNPSLGAGIESGTYILKPVSRLTGTDTWYANHQTDKNYLLATISGNTLTLVNPLYVTATVDLSATISVVSPKPVIGKNCEVKCTVTNNGDDFNSYLFIRLDDETKVGRHYDIKAGKTDEVSFKFYPRKEGSATVSLCLRKWNSNTYSYDYTTLCSCPLTVTTPVEGKLYMKTTVENSVIVTEGDYYNSTNTCVVTSKDVDLKVTMTNPLETDYDNNMAYYIYHYVPDGEGGSTSEQYLEVELPVVVPALSSEDLVIHLKDLPDNKYSITLMYMKDAYRWTIPEAPERYTPSGASFVVRAPKDTATDLDLKKGWNWLSTNIAADGELSVADFAASIGNGAAVRMDGQTAQLYGNGHTGQDVNIQPGNGYRLLLSRDAQAVRKGTAMPITSIVTIKQGANWFGYIPTIPLPVNTAMGNCPGATWGDRIVSQEGFAEYDGSKWIPENFIMRPGKGYIYTMDYDKERGRWFFQSLSDGVELPTPDETPDDALWHFDAYAYPDVMTMVCEIVDEQALLGEGQPVVGVFCDNECRGVGRWIDGKLFITVHGTFGQQETISLQARSASGEIQPVRETFNFDEQRFGTMFYPVVLHIGIESGVIAVPYSAASSAERRIFDTSGRQQQHLRQGVNIVLMPDGTARKVIVY